MSFIVAYLGKLIRDITRPYNNTHPVLTEEIESQIYRLEVNYCP